MRLRDDEEAGITDSPLLMVSVLLAVVLLVVAMTADPIALGTDVGERAPAIEGVAYDGDGWVEFSLEDYFDASWKEGEPGQWIILEFMDTDCPYCVQSAAEVGDWDAYFDASNSDWNNEDVQVIAVATELNINGHDSSRAEIQAFRDMTTGETCNKADCANRGGSPHAFPYVDDIDGDVFTAWGMRGTPSYFVIQPDGIVAWSSANTQVYQSAAEAVASLAAV
jgi:hypothetical protein